VNDARKEYFKKNIKRITLNYKVEDYNSISDTALDNGIKITTFCKACIRYCIESGTVDISELKKYI